MKKGFLYAVAASVLCCIYACNMADDPATEDIKTVEPIELTARQGEKVDADNRFTFSIFKEVSVSQGTNTFFSPLSLNMALGMLYNGASGETRTEMAEVLGMAGFTETEINEYYRKMSQALLTIDPLTELSIANSIWYRDGFQVKKPFFDVNQQYFDAVVRALDFSNPDAAGIINQWCADKTKDRIKEIIESPIPGNVMMYLINALYFKSKWQFEFDKKNTKEDDFTQADSQKIKVDMMEQTTTLPYYADDKLQCVEIPYGNQAFSMVAILPSNDMDVDQLIVYLDHTIWKNVVNNLRNREIQLKLPRFKIECDIPLNEPVKNVGMQRIFFGGLKNISDADLFVSKIQQKTFVEVNEEGTEAAAVTVIEIRESFNPDAPQPVPFFANRPFLYLIKEKSTGLILFIGRMDDPSADCNKEEVMVKFDEKTFIEQKKLWQLSNTKDYEYHLLADGFMYYNGKIRVENGNFNHEEILHENSQSIVSGFLNYSTIDLVYETIEAIFNASKNGTKRSDFYYTEILVEYDKINHIPIKINYKYYCSPNIAVDGTFDYSIKNFNRHEKK